MQFKVEACNYSSIIYKTSGYQADPVTFQAYGGYTARIETPDLWTRRMSAQGIDTVLIPRAGSCMGTQLSFMFPGDTPAPKTGKGTSTPSKASPSPVPMPSPPPPEILPQVDGTSGTSGGRRNRRNRNTSGAGKAPRRSRNNGGGKRNRNRNSATSGGRRNRRGN